MKKTLLFILLVLIIAFMPAFACPSPHFMAKEILVRLGLAVAFFIGLSLEKENRKVNIDLTTKID
jgi:hypothetical protein